MVLGFTIGAAVVIALGQLPNLLGLDLPSQATAIKSLLALIDHAGEWDHASLALGLGTLLVGALLKYRVPRWPTLLIALALGSLAAWLWPSMFGHVARVSSFVGTLPPFSPVVNQYRALSLEYFGLKGRVGDVLDKIVDRKSVV